MREIAEHFNVKLNSAVYFMRHHGIQRRTKIEARKVAFLRQPSSFFLKKHLSASEVKLKLIGTVLYWCEGYRTEKSHGIDFANSDPAAIRLFSQFLRIICGVNPKRLKGYLYCYSNQHPEKLITYWSRVSGIPKNQFTRPYIRHDFKMDKIGKMPYGLVHIRYHDIKLLEVVLGWIQELK